MLNEPTPKRFRLTEAPLVLALVQVNFPLIARLASLAGVEPLQERLADAFPYMKQQQLNELQVTFSPHGLVSPQTSSNLVTEFTDDDGWRLTVAAGQVTLTADMKSYGGVDDMVNRLSVVLPILHSELGIKRCERLGTRFVNFAANDETDYAWTEWFRPELVGWVAPGLLVPSARLLTTISETRIAMSSPSETGMDVQSVVRHGFLPAGTIAPGVSLTPLAQPTFLLDIDEFVEAPQPFDPASILTQFRAMHTDIERFFYWSLTESGKAHFGLETL